jgi:ribosomal protein S8
MAYQKNLLYLKLPYLKSLLLFLNLLKSYNYINNLYIYNNKYIYIKLNYIFGIAIIKNIKIIKSQFSNFDLSYNNLLLIRPYFLNISILLSTPKGLLFATEAIKNQIGGIPIAIIYI